MKNSFAGDDDVWKVLLRTGLEMTFLSFEV